MSRSELKKAYDCLTPSPGAKARMYNGLLEKADRCCTGGCWGPGSLRRVALVAAVNCLTVALATVAVLALRPAPAEQPQSPPVPAVSAPAAAPERGSETDTSLITFQKEPGENGEDAWGLVDEDGDGIILEEVKGEGYAGFMMVVKDPSRVIMGSVPEDFGIRGYTVEEMVQHFDAVAGINAGGFVDINGQGSGSEPDKTVVYKGRIYYGDSGTGDGFVGLDDQYILHVGLVDSQSIQNANIQYGCSFGPVLVSNGQGADPDSLASGVNPRTAIGQRSDGAILLLVIDGRQIHSLGATYEDLVEIMLRYGAVNACNLDGGSSSLMYYNGAYVNNYASTVGIRPVPTTFLVLKEGAIESEND